jgi:hypothetical protein
MNMYHGARDLYRNGSIYQHLELIKVRFSHCPGLMKTDAGRKEAEEGYVWMVDGGCVEEAVPRRDSVFERIGLERALRIGDFWGIEDVGPRTLLKWCAESRGH